MTDPRLMLDHPEEVPEDEIEWICIVDGHPCEYGEIERDEHGVITGYACHNYGRCFGTQPFDL